MRARRRRRALYHGWTHASDGVCGGAHPPPGLHGLLSLDVPIARLGKKGREKERVKGEMAGGRGLATLALTIADERDSHGPSLHRHRLLRARARELWEAGSSVTRRGRDVFFFIVKGPRPSITMNAGSDVGPWADSDARPCRCARKLWAVRQLSCLAQGPGYTRLTCLG
jgi:hypothetical protein